MNYIHFDTSKTAKFTPHYFGTKAAGRCIREILQSTNLPVATLIKLKDITPETKELIAAIALKHLIQAHTNLLAECQKLTPLGKTPVEYTKATLEQDDCWRLFVELRRHLTDSKFKYVEFNDYSLCNELTPADNAASFVG